MQFLTNYTMPTVPKNTPPSKGGARRPSLLEPLPHTPVRPNNYMGELLTHCPMTTLKKSLEPTQREIRPPVKAA